MNQKGVIIPKARLIPFFFKNKKGIGPVIAIALLIVISVVAVLGFQTWYQTYSSQIFIQSETSSNSDSMSTEIEALINSQLYFNNNLNDNISIQNIQVNGNECEIYSNDYSKGIHKFNLYNCLKDINTSIAEFVVVTNQGLYTKKIYLDEVSVSLTPIKSNPIYTPSFISVWDTSLNSSGSSEKNQISLPLISSGIYNFVVDWGDGSNNTITLYNQDEVTHNYSSEGVYTVKITGTIKGFRFNNGGDKNKIILIKKWGCLNLGVNGYNFAGCENLKCDSNIDDLNLSHSQVNWMFSGATSFDCDLSRWDLSGISNIRGMFANTNFNRDLSSWDVSSVTDMDYLFYNANNFNGDLSSWDVSSVTSMYSMFNNADSFNGDLSGWDVSSVTNMNNMFYSADSFNCDLSSWDVSSVTNMNNLFGMAISFTSDLSSWNVSSVTDMANMFYNVNSFTSDLSSWNVSSVTNMNNMFGKTNSFDSDLSSWNVSKVTSMSGMFSDAINFSHNISSWDVSSVTNMYRMFFNADSLNINLISWDVDQVTTCTQFNAYSAIWDLPIPNFTNCTV